MSTSSRTKKWHPTPPPPASPKILRLPRRRRTHVRKQTKPTTHLPKNNPLLLMNQKTDLTYKGRDLENLFHHESIERGEREDGEEGFGRSQAEMVDLLRMERELALKKLEKKRVEMETTTDQRSSVQILRRKKIMEGKSDNAALEEEMEDLAEALQKSSILKDSEKCSGRCKAIVARMVEQVRTETEQWTQMQKMLMKVRGEMEELRASRHLWESRAHNSDYQTRSLRLAVEEWREKALGYGIQVNELQLKLSSVKQKKKAGDDGAWIAMEGDNSADKKTTDPPLSLAKQLAMEKRSLVRSLKENRGSRHELCEDGRRRRGGGAYSNSKGAAPLKNIANSLVD